MDIALREYPTVGAEARRLLEVFLSVVPNRQLGVWRLREIHAYNPRVDISTGAGQTTKSADRGLFARANGRRGGADPSWRMFRVCGLVHKNLP